MRAQKKCALRFSGRKRRALRMTDRSCYRLNRKLGQRLLQSFSDGGFGYGSHNFVACFVGMDAIGT